MQDKAYTRWTKHKVDGRSHFRTVGIQDGVMQIPQRP